MSQCFLSSQAETRAEFAERSVAKLEKTIDDLEGMTFFFSVQLWGYYSLYAFMLRTFSGFHTIKKAPCFSFNCSLFFSI